MKTAACAIRFRATGDGWSVPSTRGRGNIEDTKRRRSFWAATMKKSLVGGNKTAASERKNDDRIYWKINVGCLKRTR
jgi:hypothetical protein